MSTYHAPLKDMQFVLLELAGLEDIVALPGWEEITPDVVDAVLAEAGRFAQQVPDPLYRTGDVQGARFDTAVVTAPDGYVDAYRRFVDAGWNSLTGAPEHGGQGLPQAVASLVQEMWNS